MEVGLDAALEGQDLGDLHFDDRATEDLVTLV